eukprot:GHRR01008548.1.p1 GENE.GHRR01008548.1~~GHRR01008548.1.p1  ORF type:complete len:126 (+),score=18.56 GHRR01008548.1:3749-4126(+)
MPSNLVAVAKRKGYTETIPGTSGITIDSKAPAQTLELFHHTQPRRHISQFNNVLKANNHSSRSLQLAYGTSSTTCCTWPLCSAKLASIALLQCTRMVKLLSMVASAAALSAAALAWPAARKARYP